MLEKFHKNLKNTLLDTKNKMLYEASKYDLIWGIGVDSSTASKMTETSFLVYFWRAHPFLVK